MLSFDTSFAFVQKTVDSRQNGGKMTVKIRVYGLVVWSIRGPMEVLMMERCVIYLWNHTNGMSLMGVHQIWQSF